MKKANAEYVLQVHDEVVFFADKSACDEVSEIIGEVMSWRHFFIPIKDYDVPLVAEGGYGETWNQAKGKNPLKGFVSGFESKFL